MYLGYFEPRPKEISCNEKHCGKNKAREETNSIRGFFPLIKKDQSHNNSTQYNGCVRSIGFFIISTFSVHEKKAQNQQSQRAEQNVQLHLESVITRLEAAVYGKRYCHTYDK